MSAPPAPIQDAPAPFSGTPDSEDTNPPADFIVRSSDGVDFHAHKQILGFVSVFFSNMFQFPGGNGSSPELERDGKPIVQLPESADILYRLLCVAYPARSRLHLKPADLDHICAVHEAAHKYQFIHTQTAIAEMLMEPLLLEAEPHRLFAIAMLLRIPKLAEKAALCTLKSPISPTDLSFPEMRLVTWEQVQKLYDFRLRCGEAAQKIVLETAGPFDESTTGPNGDPRLVTRAPGDKFEFVWWAEEWHTASKCMHGTHQLDPYLYGPDYWLIKPPQWFEEQIHRLGKAMLLSPTGATLVLEAPKVPQTAQAVVDACDLCTRRVPPELLEFATHLGRYIEESNEQLARGAFAQ
ncbi:hypothetical protein C8R43DRAFT_251444 [Mycena crocata]|nr:hypothetical protein C8R43DRAFT_251444 [Mycena crocata]